MFCVICPRSGSYTKQCSSDNSIIFQHNHIFYIGSINNVLLIINSSSNFVIYLVLGKGLEILLCGRRQRSSTNFRWMSKQLFNKMKLLGVSVSDDVTHCAKLVVQTNLPSNDKPHIFKTRMKSPFTCTIPY